MPTECSATLFEFARVEGRSVVGAFDGGKITSDAGALLLAAIGRDNQKIDPPALLVPAYRARPPSVLPLPSWRGHQPTPILSRNPHNLRLLV